MKRLSIAMLIMAGLSGSALAQGQIFREGQANESDYIKALQPPAPVAGGNGAGGAEPSGTAADEGARTGDGDGPRMRSIRVRPATPPSSQSVAPRPTERPNASLLITFETNSSELTRPARDSLDVVARALKSDSLANFQFSIEGHADPRGGSELNQQLSQARAESVRRYLIVAHGIAQERLQAVGKGDRELVNPGNPTAPENRRVTIVNMSGR